MSACITRLRTALKKLPPEEAALLLCVGLVLGVFPMMGVPTVLCLLAALGLRLNVPALQAINTISSPLQLALLVPMERAGAFLCRPGISSGGFAAGKIGIIVLHALAGWACCCVPAGILLYVVLIKGTRARLRFDNS